MRGNSTDDQLPIDHITESLRAFEERVQQTSLREEVSLELATLANRANAQVREGDFEQADNTLTVALLAVQRHLSSDINMRLGFELASSLVEDAKRYLAHPASLYSDIVGFSEAFLDRLPAPELHDELPQYLYQRPFPKDVGPALQQVRELLVSYELPEAALEELGVELDGLETLAAEVKGGILTTEQADRSLALIGGLVAGLTALQGSYLTSAQVQGACAMIILAWPAWLCFNVASWIVQAIILIILAIIAAIATSAETRKAVVNIWTYIESCTKSVTQTIGEVGKIVQGLSKDQLKEVLESLKEIRKEFRKGKKLSTGNKGKVNAKLNAAIADVERIIAAMP